MAKAKIVKIPAEQANLSSRPKKPRKKTTAKETEPKTKKT